MPRAKVAYDLMAEHDLLRLIVNRVERVLVNRFALGQEDVNLLRQAIQAALELQHRGSQLSLLALKEYRSGGAANSFDNDAA